MTKVGIYARLIQDRFATDVGFEDFSKLVDAFEQKQIDVAVMTLGALASLLADKYFGGVYYIDHADGMVRFGPVPEK